MQEAAWRRPALLNTLMTALWGGGCVHRVVQLETSPVSTGLIQASIKWEEEQECSSQSPRRFDSFISSSLPSKGCYTSERTVPAS